VYVVPLNWFVCVLCLGTKSELETADQPEYATPATGEPDELIDQTPQGNGTRVCFSTLDRKLNSSVDPGRENAVEMAEAAETTSRMMEADAAGTEEGEDEAVDPERQLEEANSINRTLADALMNARALLDQSTEHMRNSIAERARYRQEIADLKAALLRQQEKNSEVTVVRGPEEAAAKIGELSGLLEKERTGRDDVRQQLATLMAELTESAETSRSYRTSNTGLEERLAEQAEDLRASQKAQAGLQAAKNALEEQLLGARARAATLEEGLASHQLASILAAASAPLSPVKKAVSQSDGKKKGSPAVSRAGSKAAIARLGSKGRVERVAKPAAASQSPCQDDLSNLLPIQVRVDAIGREVDKLVAGLEEVQRDSSDSAARRRAASSTLAGPMNETAIQAEMMRLRQRFRSLEDRLLFQETATVAVKLQQIGHPPLYYSFSPLLSYLPPSHQSYSACTSRLAELMNELRKGSTTMAV